MDDSINIELVENGVICRHSWEEVDGENRKYKSETYVFPSLDEAGERLKSMFPKSEKVRKQLKSLGLIEEVTR